MTDESESRIAPLISQLEERIIKNARCKITLKPILRDTLLKNKAKAEEEKPLLERNKIIETVYNNTLSFSKEHTETAYYNEIKDDLLPLFKKFKNDIINRLSDFFPDSKVSHVVYSVGKDNNVYNITNIYEQELPHLKRATDTHFVFIDWT
jgi:hypothetical protein